MGREDQLATSGEGTELVGATWRWDEFAAHGSKGEAFARPASGARIMFGLSFNDTLERFIAAADGLDPVSPAFMSLSGNMFDVKSNHMVAPFDANTGGLLFQKYVTAETVGNYLAGHNSSHFASLCAQSISGAGSIAC